MRHTWLPVAAALVVIGCGPPTPEQEAGKFLSSLASCISENREDILAEFVASDEPTDPENYMDTCGVDFSTLTPEAQKKVEDAGKRIAAKVLPALLGSAWVSAFQEGGDSEPDLTGVLDSLTEALEEESERQLTAAVLGPGVLDALTEALEEESERPAIAAALAPDRSVVVLSSEWYSLDRPRCPDCSGKGPAARAWAAARTAAPETEPVPDPKCGYGSYPPCNSPSGEPPTDRGAWRTSRTTNPIDDSATVVATLSASQGVGGFGDDPIRLVARCQSNKTEVYFNWHDFLGDDTNDVYSDKKRVTYRFPPADATTELWGISTDNDSTFVARAIPFLRTLVESDQLVIRTTPYGESPTTATFDLTGARGAIEPIAETCSWALPE